MISVNHGEYAVLDIEKEEMANTIGLGEDIAFTVHVPGFNRAALARNISPEAIRQLFRDVTCGHMGDELPGGIQISWWAALSPRIRLAIWKNS